MGESDVQRLYKAIDKLQKTVDEVKKELSDTKVLLAGTYVTREEFDKRITALDNKVENHEKEDRANRFKFAGIVATATGIIVSVIQWMVGLWTR
ncbi:hypothetical protein V6C27_03035 [Peptococcaceae bacterium 1198_IL3148]